MSALPPWDPDEYDERIKAERLQDKRNRAEYRLLPLKPEERKQILAHPLRDDPNPTRLLGRRKRNHTTEEN
jgi:hypothetical protein